MHCCAQTNGTPAPVPKLDGSMVRGGLVCGPFPSQVFEPDFLAESGGEATFRRQYRRGPYSHYGASGTTRTRQKRRGEPVKTFVN